MGLLVTFKFIVTVQWLTGDIYQRVSIAFTVAWPAVVYV